MRGTLVSRLYGALPRSLQSRFCLTDSALSFHPTPWARETASWPDMLQTILLDRIGFAYLGYQSILMGAHQCTATTHCLCRSQKAVDTFGEPAGNCALVHAAHSSFLTYLSILMAATCRGAAMATAKQLLLALVGMIILSAAVGAPNIYVYELPPRFNADLLSHPPNIPADWLVQYDVQLEMHEYLLNHPMRTTNPDAASVFFVPLYVGRLQLAFWHNAEGYGFWTKNNVSWVTSEIRDGLTYVKSKFSYWARHNGADHFMMMSTDHGRCDAGLHLSEQDFGDLVVLTSNAETDLKWETSRYGQLATEVEFMSCFRSHHDMSVPQLFSNGSNIQPFPAGPGRPHIVLLRFTGHLGGLYGNVRTRLLELFANSNALSAVGHVSMGWASKNDTDKDMQSSIFCITPPGHTQDTERFYRAIFNGCIPVTFFSNVELPFSEELGLKYADFTVNLGQLDWHRADVILKALLMQPDKIAQLQQKLNAAQTMFNWDRASSNGVQANIVKMMQSSTRRLAQGSKAQY